MSSENENVTSEKKQAVLEHAWKRFADYDKSSMEDQSRYLQLREIILILGVVSVFLAILHSVLKLATPPWVSDFNNFLRYLVILTPIIVGVLQVGSVKFKSGSKYVLLRGSAEAVKREIYRYRVQSGVYGLKQTKNDTRETKLANRVNAIAAQLIKTEVNETALTLYPENGKLPPPNTIPKDDDGFSDLDAEKYLTWRLEDQLSFYRKRASTFTKKLHQYMWLIFALGGASTFLAAIGLEIWIAVTISISAAIVGFLELKQVEATIVVYNQVATDLEGIRSWWHSMPSEERTKPETKEKLVQTTENLLMNELVGWVQRMYDALAELYKEGGETR